MTAQQVGGWVVCSCNAVAPRDFDGRQAFIAEHADCPNTDRAVRELLAEYLGCKPTDIHTSGVPVITGSPGAYMAGVYVPFSGYTVSGRGATKAEAHEACLARVRSDTERWQAQDREAKP